MTENNVGTKKRPLSDAYLGVQGDRTHFFILMHAYRPERDNKYNTEAVKNQAKFFQLASIDSKMLYDVKRNLNRLPMSMDKKIFDSSEANTLLLFATMHYLLDHPDDRKARRFYHLIAADLVVMNGPLEYAEQLYQEAVHQPLDRWLFDKYLKRPRR